MTNIDQFESVFKAAEKRLFAPETIRVKRILVIVDEYADHGDEYLAQVKSFLSVLESEEEPVDWRFIGGDEFDGVGKFLQRIGENEPDLICTYRNLHIPATEYPYSLGVYIDVLTQATEIPIMLTPHPTHLDRQKELMRDTSCVVAITDHLSGEDHLVSYAAALTRPDNGVLWLTHIEDQTTFDRYLDAIGKISAIPTDDARISIRNQLLKEPAEYIESCRQKLHESSPSIRVEEEIVFGRLLDDYKRLIENHNATLLVMNTKDEEQLAMHGMAYPLSIEMRETPLLLI